MDSATANFTAPLDIEQIQRIIPHRYPFLLIDRIVELTESCVASIKSVSANEPFFEGHFPGKKVMPGVLQLEAMAQTGAVWVLAKPEFRGKIALLAGVKDAKFRRPVVPGDQLRIECRILTLRSRMGVMACQCMVDGKVACEAEVMFAIARDEAQSES